MSRITTIVWMLIAVALTASAYFLTRFGGTGTEEVTRLPVFDLSASAIEKLRFKRAGAPVQWVESSGDAAWDLLTEATAGGAGDTRWPVRLENVQSALRQIASMTGEPTDEPGGIDANAEELWAITTAGSRWVMTVGSAQLGGLRTVRVRDPEGRERFFRVERGLIDALLTTGPEPWRDSAVFRDLARVSQVSLASGGESVRLSRSGEKWAVMEPSAPTDGRAIERLFGALARITSTRFIPGDPGTIAQPLAVIEITYIARSGDGAASRVVQRLEIGAPDDLSQNSVRAVYERRVFEAASPTPVSVSRTGLAVGRDPLDPIRANPMAYVSPFPIRTPAPEIGGLRLEQAAAQGGEAGAAGGGSIARVRRTASGWSVAALSMPGAAPANAAPAETPLDEEGVSAMSELLRSATAIPSTWVWRRTAAPTLRPVATATIESLTGAPLEKISIVIVEDPEQSGGETVSVGFATDSVVWAFAPGLTMDTLERIVRASGLEWPG